LTISFTETLVVMTCWCGINHAVPRDLQRYQQRQFDNGERITSIFCPLGHQHQPAGLGRAGELSAQLDAERTRTRRLREEVDRERRSHSATKGQITKLKRRVGKGVCPCCNRHFANVERHMATQHPDYSEPVQ
jgi:hypothetical protein